MTETDITKSKELRRNVVFFYTKGQAVRDISRHCGVSGNVVRKVLTNYLRHEGRLSPNYTISVDACKTAKSYMSNKKESAIADAALALLIPESVYRKIMHYPAFQIDEQWISSCAYNFSSLGYKESEIVMPSGTDSTIKMRIVNAMKNIITPKEKGDVRMITPQQTNDIVKQAENAAKIGAVPSAVKGTTPVTSDQAKARGLKTGNDVQTHIDFIQTFLKTAFDYEDGRASEIAYVGKYFILGNDIQKIARLMAMEKDINGVQKDLNEFLAAEDCLAHPEKQSCTTLKKSEPKKTDSLVTYIRVPNGQRKCVPADIDKLIEEYKSGTSIIDLSGKYKGVSQGTISDILKKHNIPIRARGNVADVNIADIVKDFKAGMSVMDIAEKHDTSYSVVYNRLRKEGLIEPHKGTYRIAPYSAKVDTAEQPDAAQDKPVEPKVEVPKAVTPAPAKTEAKPAQSAKTNRVPSDKFGNMDFFLDMYMVIASTPGITALDFMRLMLDIADSKSPADKSAVARKMVSVIATSKDPTAIDAKALQSTVETYVAAADALAQM